MNFEDIFVSTGFEPTTLSKIVTNTMKYNHVSHIIVQVENEQYWTWDNFKVVTNKIDIVYI